MAVVYDAALSEQQRQMAEKVISEFQIEDIRVIVKDDVFHFIQDRRVVHVPPTLILKDRWSDLRYLFRAILTSGPAVWNRGAPNTWGPEGPSYASHDEE